MAASALTVATMAGKTGIAAALAAANVDGNFFDNDGRTWLEVVNGGGASITVTIAVPYTVDGSAVTPPTVTVPAGARRLIGKLDTTIYNNGSNQVNVTYSGVTSVTVGAFRMN